MQIAPGTDASAQPRKVRPDVRRRALVITVLSTLALGGLLALEPPRGDLPPPKRLAFSDLLPLEQPKRTSEAAVLKEVQLRFEQGVAMLRMRQYEYALTAFHQVLALAPKIPEAHVNMGFALIGLEQWKHARSFFESAIELRRDQINAYFGLALTLDALGDRAGAMGAMQTYLHRAPGDDPFRPRAESAIWEWRDEARKSIGVNERSEPAVKEH